MIVALLTTPLAFGPIILDLAPIVENEVNPVIEINPVGIDTAPPPKDAPGKLGWTFEDWLAWRAEHPGSPLTVRRVWRLGEEHSLVPVGDYVERIEVCFRNDSFKHRDLVLSDLPWKWRYDHEADLARVEYVYPDGSREPFRSGNASVNLRTGGSTGAKS